MTALLLVSDFNLGTLGRYLQNMSTERVVHPVVAPYGQVTQTLLSNPTEKIDTAVVWTRPEAVLPTFSDALALKPVDHRQVILEVEAFADLVLQFAQRVPAVFVVAWTLPSSALDYGMLDYRPGLGLTNLLAQANLTLAERLARAPSVFILNPERWIREAGSNAFSAKLWAAAKSPFGNSVYQTAALAISFSLDGLEGRSRRLIVLDCDNTLWGGVVGEVGWQGVRLGGHDHVGEAFQSFQRGLKALQSRGIQLAVLSKNDEATALDVFDNHSEMILRRNDLAGWRIDWRDKGMNLVELVDELNIGLASVVFIDDMPAERGRISEAFPSVLVPDWPTDPTHYAEALAKLGCFETPTLTTEDRQRSRMYVAERERSVALASASSIADWLRTLGLKVEAAAIGPDSISRATQLLNKTNQLNLSTRRLSEKEFSEWAEAKGHRAWTFRVADRFGDAGLTGLVSVALDGKAAKIVDFVMSCRVMGRGVEKAMLSVAIQHARNAGAEEIVAQYLRTERNGPTLEMMEGSGLDQAEPGLFRWDARKDYAAPEFIDLRAN